MPYPLKLRRSLTLAGWRVRIHDAEGPEEPHVTIYKKGRKWRLSLRTGEFLDAGDKWSQIDNDVRSAIRKKWSTLRKEWNKRYGHFNPISSEDAE